MSSTKNEQKSVNEQNSIKKKEPARKKTTVRAAITSNRRRKILAGHWHNVAMLLILYDLAVVFFLYITALWLRYDLKFSTIDHSFLKLRAGFNPIYTIFCLFVFLRTRLPKTIKKYARYTELLYVIVVTLITASFQILFITVFFRYMPILYYIMGPTLQFLLITMVRFLYRFVLLLRNGQAGSKTYGRVITIGGGNACQAISCDIHRSRDQWQNHVLHRLRTQQIGP